MPRRLVANRALRHSINLNVFCHTALLSLMAQLLPPQVKDEIEKDENRMEKEEGEENRIEKDEAKNGMEKDGM